MTAPGIRGGPRGIGDSLPGLLSPTHIGIIIQIPGAGADCVRQLLDGVYH